MHADETTQFKIIVEQLELCCSYINEKSISKYRIALILLDNVAEIIMQRLCQQVFERDNFIKWIMPQQFTLPNKIKINRFFGEKTKALNKEKKIPKQIARILSIGHKYRNAVYHRDEYNTEVIGAITKILFIAVCDLFAKSQCGIKASVIGGHERSFKW